MSHDAIAALDAAITNLEAELGNDPRYALLSSLKQAREAFSEKVDTALATAQQANLLTKIKMSTVDEPRLSPNRAQAFQICKQALVGHTQPVKTRTLYELVEDNGINLPGGQNNLSSMLARHPTTFKGHGRAGWTLKSVENGAEPSSDANGDGSAPKFDLNQKGGEGHEATTTH